jgi:diguanylate cyclase (GGDEF)-like protein
MALEPHGSTPASGHNDPMPDPKLAEPPRSPQTATEFRAWVQQRLRLAKGEEADLLHAFEAVLNRQRELWQESKHEAIQAMREAFADKIGRLQTELVAKDTTVSNIARYFEDVVAELTEKAHRDPKTKLMNFDWFVERVESFLAVEQRARWCAVGVVDITAFKWFNDNLGHPAGDRIIERVATILGEQIRSEDLLAQERSIGARDMHARFGGDEFCFFIPDLPDCETAAIIAGRFKAAVELYDWTREHERLAMRPVKVDVGVICLRLGPLAERRGNASRVAAQMIQFADTLMYGAKGRQEHGVSLVGVRLENGTLVENSERSPIPFRRRPAPASAEPALPDPD